MNLNEWYEKGLTPEQYMDSLDYHKDNFLHIYENFQLPADDEFFNQLKEKNLRVVALAEVWCGHCMLNVPVLLKLAEKTDMGVRILPRDQHLELMDQYLTNGKRVIPIFIFIDENGEQAAKWGPITESTKAFVNELKKDVPPKEDPGYDEKFKVMIKKVAEAFRENPDFWSNSYEDMKKTLSDAK
ncbi:thioredoxin family protein [Siminovitchia sediminis]|uniref:Thioredoxin family protein n=1 Tax=Siminovitchia sediminis TaxID=1274353 RepID=A0ABW4KE43_9BACI